LSKCLDLASKQGESGSKSFDIRYQLFKAFGYNNGREESKEEGYFLNKRRGGMEDMRKEFSSVVFIKESTDGVGVTPVSSLDNESMEFGFNNKTTSILSKTPTSSLSALSFLSLSPSKQSKSPKIMQKVLEKLQSQGSKPAFPKKFSRKSYKENSLREAKKSDIISRAKEACSMYLRQMEKEQMLETPFEVFLHESTDSRRPEHIPRESAGLSSVHKRKYRDYLLSEEEIFSSEKKENDLNEINELLLLNNEAEDGSCTIKFSKKRNISD
jgi:hypothetical protein